MKTESEYTDEAPVDKALSATLKQRYGRLSRRSFFSLATRALIKVAGISVAAEVLPFLTSIAHADSNCGLHGWICGTGTCSGGTTGGSAGRWAQCCDIGCGVWSCISYYDHCGTRPANWGQGCAGVTPSGPPWCGTAGGQYICTEVSSSGNYSSLSACQTGCTGAPSCAY